MSAAVVFDLGDVVCRFHPERRLRALADATRLPTEVVEAAIWGSGLEARGEVGDFDLAALQQEILGALDWRVDGDSLGTAWASAFVPDDAVCRLVDQVRPARYLFTNNGPILTECLHRELEPVRLLFSRTVCSWELGARKPSPLAFRRLAARIGHSCDDITFVDDDPANCAAAESTGMRTVQFRHVTQLHDRLEEFQLLES